MATITLDKQPALSLTKQPVEAPVDGDTLYSSDLYTLALKYRAMDAIASTPELLDEARGWLSDCFPYSGDDWSTAHAKDIAGMVQRHYEGGAIGFYLASRALAPVITRTN